MHAHRFETVADAIATVSATDIAGIKPDSRLVEDLGLDSLELAELLVTLLDDGALDDVSVADVRWETVTVDDLATGRLFAAARVQASDLARHRTRAPRT